MMIYRIFFQPKGAFWCIQFKSWFWWSNVKGEVVDLENPSAPVTTYQITKFDTLENAERYCHIRGIDRAYHRAQTATYVTAILSGARTEEQELDAAEVFQDIGWKQDMDMVATLAKRNA